MRIKIPSRSKGWNSSASCSTQSCFFKICLRILLQWLCLVFVATAAAAAAKSLQSCPTPSNPMDCSPPGSSIHGICQARVLEWGAIVATECCLFSRKIIWHRSSRKEIVWSPLISSKQQNHQWGTYQHFFPNSLLIGTGRRFFKSTVEDGHFLCAPLRAGISNTPGTEGPCDCL